jgi:hypothetical protein
MQEMSMIEMEIITFAKWKEALNSKWVKYTWSYIQNENPNSKEFESCRFYASPDKESINLPKFIISKNQKFIKIDDKTYKTESQDRTDSVVIFEILGDTKPCPNCNSCEFITKKMRKLECSNPIHLKVGISKVIFK